MLTCLPFGWWHFIKRNIPQISFNWGLVSTGVICSVLALVLGNWILSALYEQIQTPSLPGKPARKWRWKWTISLYASIWILFLIAFGAAGVSQHATWLLNNNQSWYERRRSSYELVFAKQTIKYLLMDNDQDLARTRKAVFAESKSFGGQIPFCEAFNVIFYGNSNHTVAAYLVIPRDPELIAKGEFAVFGPDDRDLIQPLSQLQQTLSELDAEYSVTANH
jgi:hypothetical protein